VDQFNLILDSSKIAFSLLISLWWVYLPVLLFVLTVTIIQNYTRLKYIMSIEWVLLEIKVPRDIHRSPKAMEQVFTALHGTFILPKKREAFLKGKVIDWFSFELVGGSGDTHFYIRTRKEYRNLLESQVYAQFPEAEIAEKDDYINNLPYSLPDDKYDVWGAEYILNKEDAYPIRTYPEFEEKSLDREGIKRVDPLASLAELFSTLQPNEHIIIQALISPTGDDWIKKGEATLDRIMGKASAPQSGGILSDMVFAIDRAIGGASDETEKKEERKPDLSPGKQEIMKSIEKSFDKLGFETTIRFAYIAPKEIFSRAHVSGIIGAYKQFSSQNLNGFKMNLLSAPLVKGISGLIKPIKVEKEFQKKRWLYNKLRERRFYGSGLKGGIKKFVLNTEELATIYHFPDVGVRSPLLPRVEAKKGEPPAGLPIA
jgi:hypothetical protein